jgi:hypothetical protein
MAATASLLAHHTIAVVHARRLLPRWDLITHLEHGWIDYHLLVTGQVHRLLWDLWMQGYWPPALSIAQIPLYLARGGDMAAGLWTALVVFCLVGVVGTAIIVRVWGTAGTLPAGLFLAGLLSSPFVLAYASVTMTEMLGALTQLLVVLAYAQYRQSASPATTRRFALALTLLFFTKYNYFLLLVGPLVVFEWLERSADLSARERMTRLWLLVRRLMTSPTVLFVTAYLVAMAVVIASGGVEFGVLGQRVSITSIGNSGHVVLYVLLGRLWYLHRQGRIDWAALMATDPRVRALLVWCALPITIWMASPYPNHIRDFTNLVINSPMGAPTVGASLAAYAEALQSSYFYAPWTLVLVVGLCIVAAVRSHRHTPVMQWVLLMIPLQLGAIAVHQTRFPRFLLPTVVLMCLAAAIEVGRWCAGSPRRRLVAAVLTPVAVAAGVLATRTVVGQERFRVVAFELYTDSSALRNALDTIRPTLTDTDRLAVVGQNSALSPGLFRWELGPPSGVPCFPYELAGARRLDLADATRVLLIESLRATSPLDATDYYPRQRQSVLNSVARGEFTLEREFPVADLGVILRDYRRTTPLTHDDTCW